MSPEGIASADGHRIAPGYGVLALEPAPDGVHARLVVSGPDPAGVLRAADALVSTTGRTVLSGRVAVIHDLRTGPSTGQVRPSSRIALSQLGLADTQFAGLGSHQTSVTFLAPPLNTSGFGYLHVDYTGSSLLDPRTSSISVILNDENLGTINPASAIDGIHETQLRFSGLLLRPGKNVLTFDYELRSPDVCRRPADTAITASLSSSSSLELPAAQGQSALDLKLLPYPVLDDPGNHHTNVLFSDSSGVDPAAIFTAVAALGSRSTGDPTALRAVRASELRPAGQATSSTSASSRPRGRCRASPEIVTSTSVRVR